MQEEMRKNTLGSLVENEKKGTIYAKIRKQKLKESVKRIVKRMKNIKG